MQTRPTFSVAADRRADRLLSRRSSPDYDLHGGQLLRRICRDDRAERRRRGHDRRQPHQESRRRPCAHRRLHLRATKTCVERCAYRLSAPGLGQEVGANLGLLPSFYQGFFLAPTVVAGALKGAIFAANHLRDAWASASFPNGTESRHDIIQAVELGSARGHDRLLRGHSGRRAGRQLRPTRCRRICRAMTTEVIMAAGAFVQGSSIELSRRRPDPPALRRLFSGRPDLVSCQAGHPAVACRSSATRAW